jgi:hypothetical protein
MLRDDAIREGLTEPTIDDIERMKLTKTDLATLEKIRAGKAGKTEAAPVASAGSGKASGSTGSSK